MGRKIRKRRIEMGWSQDYLAKVSEMSRVYVNKIETDKVKNPGVKSLHKIAYALGLKLDELCEHFQKDRTTKPAYPAYEDKKHVRLYRIWTHIKQRCYNVNHDAYHRYGGRGIKVCSAWKDGYLSFKEWALNNGYKTDLTIDRIDNDGNYEPKNCQWITKGQNTKKGSIDKRNSQCLTM
jgi:transcriptional regulator with XRE-family HTH domain